MVGTEGRAASLGEVYVVIRLEGEPSPWAPPPRRQIPWRLVFDNLPFARHWDELLLLGDVKRNERNGAKWRVFSCFLMMKSMPLYSNQLLILPESFSPRFNQS